MFCFGKKSLGNLIGVYPPLAAVAMEAIKISKTDFSVFEGVRTIKRQRMLVRSGRSRTLRSYHLNGLALDLVPFIDGKLTWSNIKAFKEIERAINEASKKLGYDFIHRPFSWDLAHWQCSGKKEEYDIRNLTNKVIC